MFSIHYRVKELREQAAIAEQDVKAREAKLQARFEALQAKATEQVFRSLLYSKLIYTVFIEYREWDI